VPAPHPDAETWRKVGLRAGDRLRLLHAPAHWDAAAGPPDVVVTRRRGAAPVEVAVAFYGTTATLRREAKAIADAITTDGMVWVAWPRKAAGHESDLSDEVVRAALLSHGLVDVKVAMLDEDWSGLKFVWRRERRAGRRAGRPAS
jgi:hypothetical protein